MIEIKTRNQIVRDFIEDIEKQNIKVDTKEGTFIRDVFIDPPANELAELYGKILLIQLAQSILTARGNDLDRIAANYFIERKGATSSVGEIIFYLKEEPQNNIFLPANIIVSSDPDEKGNRKTFKTTESKTIIRGDLTTYEVGDPIELGESGTSSSAVYFVRVNAESVEPGENMNLIPGTIKNIETMIPSEFKNEAINVKSFNGGTDIESDRSLQLRISLAISGNNIGTKDGYLSFMLKQPEVESALVIDAGNNFMLRDIDDRGYHEGGKVDIYVKDKENTQEYTQISVIEYDNEGKIKPTLLDKQPVTEILAVYLEGFEKETYIEGENFILSNMDKKLKFQRFNHLLPTIKKYIKNIETTDDLLGTLYAGCASQYYTNGGLLFGEPNVDNLKAYALEWLDINNDPNKIIKLANGEIKQNPHIGEKIVIKYQYDKTIEDLQRRLDNSRILTADVMIKKARKVDFKISAKVRLMKNYSEKQVIDNIKYSIYNYVNNMQKLGAEIDQSDIVYLIKSIDGVNGVDTHKGLDRFCIKKIGDSDFSENKSSFELLPYEYFEISNDENINIEIIDNL